MFHCLDVDSKRKNQSNHFDCLSDYNVDKVDDDESELSNSISSSNDSKIESEFNDSFSSTNDNNISKETTGELNGLFTSTNNNILIDADEKNDVNYDNVSTAESTLVSTTSDEISNTIGMNVNAFYISTNLDQQ